MASLINMSEACAIEADIAVRFLDTTGDPVTKEGLPLFNHHDQQDWLHKRSSAAYENNIEVSLARKCE